MFLFVYCVSGVCVIPNERVRDTPVGLSYLGDTLESSHQNFPQNAPSMIVFICSLAKTISISVKTAYSSQPVKGSSMSPTIAQKEDVYNAYGPPRISFVHPRQPAAPVCIASPFAELASHKVSSTCFTGTQVHYRQLLPASPLG